MFLQLLKLSIVLTLIGRCYAEEEVEGTRLGGKKEAIHVNITEPEVEQPQRTTKAHQVFPYTMDDMLVVEELDWTKYRQDYPPYVSIYVPPPSEFFMYLYPPKHCDAVWLCFVRRVNISSESELKLFDFDVSKACDESLRFHPLEQMVYVTYLEYPKLNPEEYDYEVDPTRKAAKYPYWSNLVEITYSTDDAGNRIYQFRPYEGDFDGEDVSKVKKGNQIKVNLYHRILLLTSSPYCHARLMIPFQGPLDGGKVLYWGKDDEQAILREFATNEAKPSMYFLTSSKQGSTLRQGLWKNAPATAFDPPARKMKKSTMDCCPATWEFEGFILKGEWIREPKITYLKYNLARVDSNECGSDKQYPDQLLQSILLELGEACEWVRLCFDQGKDSCSDDVNTLAFVFIHGMMIPTDSEEARQIGLPFNKLDAIRINFIRGSRGIEVGYAFADHINPAIRELMQLEIYDGKDPSNLKLTLVRAPFCEARLLNDLGSANIRYGTEYERQCLSISKCECFLAD